MACMAPKTSDLRTKCSAGMRLEAPEPKASRPVSEIRAEALSLDPASESPGKLVTGLLIQQVWVGTKNQHL